MKYAKMRKLFLVTVYTVRDLIATPRTLGGKKQYTVLLHGTEFEEKNQGEKCEVT